MKFITIIFLFIFSKNIFAQNDTIIYQKIGKNLENCQLILYPNNIFQFEDFTSHRLEYSFKGIWKKENKKLVFIDTLLAEEQDLKIKELTQNTNFILITIKNEDETPLEGIKLKIYFLNSFRQYTTNKKGQVKIKKTNTHKINFEICYKDKEKIFVINTCFKSIHNKIDIIPLKTGKDVKIIRNTFYKIKGDKIYFDTQNLSYSGEAMGWGTFKIK